MKDPYETLGLNRNATKEEVKKAYRELAKKYHPDRYMDNPLSDLAQEKFREVQEAYDTIMQGSAYSGQGYQNTTGYGQGTSFATVRQSIQLGKYIEAIRMLEQYPLNDRRAEWYFLMGVANYHLGHNIKGMTYLQQAIQMEPQNLEYRTFFNNIQNMQRAYQSKTYNYNKGNDPCDCCAQLYCADCLCECLGGDLISCC